MDTDTHTQLETHTHAQICTVSAEHAEKGSDWAVKDVSEQESGEAGKLRAGGSDRRASFIGLLTSSDLPVASASRNECSKTLSES